MSVLLMLIQILNKVSISGLHDKGLLKILTLTLMGAFFCPSSSA